MSEKRSHVLSVDLGERVSVLLDRMVTKKNTKSDVVRKCVEMGYLYDLVGRYDSIDKSLSAVPAPKVKRGPQPMTDEEKGIIELWREVYQYEGRIHTAAYLSVIRRAEKDGVSHEEIRAMIEISPNDAWIASLLTREGTVPLTTILAEKTIATLLPLADSARRSDADRVAMRLEGVVKPRALNRLKGLVATPEMYSGVYDRINRAKTEDEVDEVVAQVLAVTGQAQAEALDHVDDTGLGGVYE